MTSATDWEDRAGEFLVRAAGIELERRIGEGGAGCAYAGESRPELPVSEQANQSFEQLLPRENWPSRVCVKFVPPDSKMLTHERDGIRRVARVQREERHPHLLTLCGHADFEEGFIEVMELADEVSEHSFQTLERHIWAQTRLSPKEAYTIIRCLSEAAQHLRNHDRRHQDIKPANVVCVGGVWKLADFGAVIIESQSRREGRLMREPYGPDTAGLARTLYAMLSGEYFSEPFDPLPEDLLPLGDVLHDELILPAARGSELIKSPARFLEQLDRVYAGGSLEPDLPPAEHIRKLADAMAAQVSNQNRRVLCTLGCTAAITLATVAALTVAATLYLPLWAAGAPSLLGAAVVTGAIVLYRRAGRFWTIDSLAGLIDAKAGTSNLILSALDYSCGAESGRMRAKKQVWLIWRCLDASVPPMQWFSTVASGGKTRFWAMTPRLLRPRAADRRVAMWKADRNRTYSPARLIEPKSNFAVDIAGRAQRQYDTFKPSILRDPFVDLLKRWGIGLLVGLLLLMVLWFALSTTGKQHPDPPSQAADSETAKELEQPDENTAAELQSPPPSEQEQAPQARGAGQPPLSQLDQEQLARALRRAQEALEQMAQSSSRKMLEDSGVSSESLQAVEQFVQEAQGALNAAGSSVAQPGGQSGRPESSRAAQAAGAPGGSSLGTTDQPQGAGLASAPVMSQAGQSSNQRQAGAQEGTEASQQAASSESQAGGLRAMAQEAADVLQQAQQALGTLAPLAQNLANQRAAQAAANSCGAAAQALKALASAARSGVPGSGSPQNGPSSQGGSVTADGGREPGTGSSPDHGGGAPVQLTLDGRVVALPSLSFLRGGDQEQPAAEGPEVTPSSLQRRSEGESVEGMILDDHKKRAVQAILSQEEDNTT